MLFIFIAYLFTCQDLDVYASSYKGVTKLQRLLFIANHCPSLAVDALR